MKKYILIWRHYECPLNINGDPSPTCTAMTSQTISFQTEHEQNTVLRRLNNEATQRGLALDIIDINVP